jgi:hypothetical protein
MKSLSTAAACMENACNLMFLSLLRTKKIFIINIASLTLLLLAWCVPMASHLQLLYFLYYTMCREQSESVRDEEEKILFSKMLLNFLDVAELTCSWH